MIDDEFSYYSGLNEEKYLFRSCYFSEIKKLITEGEINKYDLKGYSENIFLTYSYEYALFRINEQRHAYCVIYDREKLIKQGAFFIPLNVYEFQKLPQNIKFQTKNGHLRKNYFNNETNKYNQQILNKYLQQNNQTFQNTSATTLIYDKESTPEYDVIIPKIKFEHGLIHDILITHNNTKQYYQDYIKLKNLLENLNQ
jgi:hypothetical protein